jgi:two-component system sensor histidine kinase/response regulator
MKIALAVTPLNILLVDDRPENLLVLEHMLVAPDRQLFKATSGNEALRLVLKHEFALVLLDIEMPEMDGYETARLIHTRESTRSLPIIFVTASDRGDERLFRGYEVGAVDFLYKPINPRILKGKVEVFAELHRRRAEVEAANGELQRTHAALRGTIADLEFVNRTLSHDLRAPLRSIEGFSRILSESLHGQLDTEQQDYLTRIVKAGGRMGRMLDDLFELLRVSGADTVVADIKAGPVLAGVLEDLRTDIARAEATITHDPLPAVRASAVLLAQIFQNLIANALKFRSAEPPAIHVSAERAAGGWELCVRDNGIGIDPEHRERIFGLFERLGGDVLPGTGVGLTLCKRAVEKLGGRIWVESRSGEGASFYFFLPS